ncbi:MAG: secretion system protein E [Nitrosomonadales bacterium]|nr:MAG: secretion system protein E [Nitrosomonadales bacterium]
MPSYSSLFTGAPAGESTPPQPRQQYRLLLVDDEPNVLKSLQRVFRQENYLVATAPNAGEALQLMRQGTFQVVISDYMMPGVNGAEFLKQVKALYPETIRIMLTGHADTGAVMGAVNEGAVYKFILKPWNDDDLRVTVSLALEQHDLIQKNHALQQENTKKSKEISALSRLAVTNRSQLAIMLNKRGVLNDNQVQELHRMQQKHKDPVLKLLLDKGWVNERQVRDLLHKELLFEEVALAEFRVDPAVAALIPRSFCERQLVVPLRLDGRRLMLALADPLDAGLIDDLRFTSGLEIQAVMADIAAIRTKIGEVYGEEEVSFEDLETLVSSSDPYEGIEVVIEEDEEAPSLEELLRGTEEPPAIRLVNAVLLEAIRLGASDIHIQPRTKSVVVRLRIDGVLVDKIQIPHQLHQSLVSRLKVMSELDISERRRPQDGRLMVKTPLRVVDLRISTLPTINGEKVVMRILDRNAAVHSLEGLGFGPQALQQILDMVDKPQGIILATGPTGSGKTTTLYSLLQHNATASKNYVTIEDPVEYYLDMAGQVLVKEKIGLTFPVILRSILRQDPDVILLGEIRDFETAEVAFHAALTGHQVFSTLHTNSALATISRLLDLGLKPYVIATALQGIIAQRLVRKICTSCRAVAEPDPQLLARLGEPFQRAGLQVFRGAGCPECHGSGYKGRLGLYEVLTLDEQLRHLIGSGSSLLEVAQTARKSGLIPLTEDARDKVDQGLTTPEEVLRVLGPQ